MKISIRNGSKSYKKNEVLKNVEADFLPGKIVAVLGVNGSGKTTLLELIYGILALDEGEVTYDGEIYDIENLERRRKLFYLPYEPPFGGSHNLSGLSFIAEMAKIWKCEEKPNLVDEILARVELFGISEVMHRPINQLSRGEQYKVALTAFFSLGTELCLFDEPFSSGIDAPGADAFRAECRQAAKEGKTIIFTTQFTELVDRFADQICRIEGSALTMEEVKV